MSAQNYLFLFWIFSTWCSKQNISERNVANWHVSGSISVGWWGSSLSALGCVSHLAGTWEGGLESERENFMAELRAAVLNRCTETCFTFHHNVNSLLSLCGMPSQQQEKCVTWQCVWFRMFSLGIGECWSYFQSVSWSPNALTVPFHNRERGEQSCKNGFVSHLIC